MLFLFIQWWTKEKWVKADMKDKYTEHILKYHKDKPDTGDFLDEQLGYNKDGETPIYGRGGTRQP